MRRGILEGNWNSSLRPSRLRCNLGVHTNNFGMHRLGTQDEFLHRGVGFQLARLPSIAIWNRSGSISIFNGDHHAPRM